MATREEIREGLGELLKAERIAQGSGLLIRRILEYLHSQDIKFSNGESLIEVKDAK